MPPSVINFADTIHFLSSDQVWEYELGSPSECADVRQQTQTALQKPVDFPPIQCALVPGDRVALAVDPNVPSVTEVIRGALQTLDQTAVGHVDIALWDEATEETEAAIRDQVGDRVGVCRHRSGDREALRYVGADAAADPIYLNRLLVDADFVLPIVAGRPLDTVHEHDLTGVFPFFADSASRQRYARRHQQLTPATECDPCEPSWLLGIQVMLSVLASDQGQAGQIIAGTPSTIRDRLTPPQRAPDEYPPSAPLVVVSLDGDRQQQTWSNAARAVAAGATYVQPGGTIVLWSDIDQTPTGPMLKLVEQSLRGQDEQDRPEWGPEGEFPDWDESLVAARTLARVMAEHRLLIHSRLDEETTEAIGLASVQSASELTRLSRSFDACGVLRAAQFAGTTVDALRRPHG